MSPKTILVIGDSCEDVYIYGRCDRLCPDAPVPVLLPTKIVRNGGMARNVFENIKSLHPDVEIITNKKTLTKTRFIHEKTNQMFIRIDEGEHVPERINISSLKLHDYDIIVISDYCKGFVTEEDINDICNNHSKVFIDTKKILGNYCKNAKFIKINEIEYNNNINSKIDMFLFRDNLIVTLGDKGCRYKEDVYPVSSVEIKDMTGAGDTFISCLAVKYLQTEDERTAIEYANACATLIVQHKGVNRIGDFIT